jgi:hypothetical protein
VILTALCFKTRRTREARELGVTPRRYVCRVQGAAGFGSVASFLEWDCDGADVSITCSALLVATSSVSLRAGDRRRDGKRLLRLVSARLLKVSGWECRIDLRAAGRGVIGNALRSPRRC